jgi:hypothetical protein
MKKTIIILATIASLSACKKSINKDQATTQQVYYIRVQEVDNDGTETETHPAIVKINK